MCKIFSNQNRILTKLLAYLWYSIIQISSKSLLSKFTNGRSDLGEVAYVLEIHDFELRNNCEHVCSNRDESSICCTLDMYLTWLSHPQEERIVNVTTGNNALKPDYLILESVAWATIVALNRVHALVNHPLFRTWWFLQKKSNILKMYFNIYSYWKENLERNSDPKKDIHSTVSLPANTARSPFQIPCAGAGFPGCGPPCIAFLGHKQAVGWEEGQPRHELAPVWDHSTCKVSI